MNSTLSAFLVSSLLLISHSLAQTTPDDQGPRIPDATPKKPEVERISETTFKIGAISFDTANKELSFPGKINMTEGLLEYVIIMPHGKMHESLIVTEANPFDLNVALKLMKFPAMDSYFPELDENFTPIPRPALKDSDLAPSRLKATVSWTKDGETHSHSLSGLIKNTKSQQAMTEGRWLYTGSVIDNGKYMATVTGDLVAILNNRASIINFDGPDSENDEIWVPATELLPEIGTAVTITLSPASAKQD